MKISEVIQKLISLREEHGDIDCVIHNEGYAELIRNVVKEDIWMNSDMRDYDVWKDEEHTDADYMFKPYIQLS